MDLFRNDPPVLFPTMSIAASPDPDSLPLAAFFTRPGLLPSHAELKGRVAVMDLAFNGSDPQKDITWARELGERLAVWIDHHDQPSWEGLRGIEPFLLVPRSEAPACPPLVTREVVAKYGPADTVLAHGDLDGVLSAAKWMVLEEDAPVPDWLDPDGIAADTRRGTLTPRGRRLDRALRAAGRNRLRRAVVASVLAEARGLPEEASVTAMLDKAEQTHAGMREAARRLAGEATILPDLDEKVSFVNLLELPSDFRVDLTEMMLLLQARFDFVVVLGRKAGGGNKLVVSTDSNRTGLDLREEFELEGFAPFRVHVPAAQLLKRLPSEVLRRATGA